MSDRLICGFEVHEAATLFPLITGPDFDALVEDIRANGQLDPVTLDAAERIIDGRNRARACERLGIKPKTTTYTGNDVVQFVVSHNLHRRHLTDSQRAMIAAKLARRAPGERRAIAEAKVPNPSYEGVPPSQAEASEMLQVSESSVQKARRVVTSGTPQLQALVEEGHAPVATAARVAVELSDDQQNAYVEKVRSGADPVKAAPPNLQQRKWDARRADAKPARDEFHKRTRHLDAEQIIENAVGTLEGIATALELVAGTTPTLDKEKRTAWLEALRGPLSAINTFKKELAS